MAQPVLNTNGILVTTAGTIATPAAGYVTYFFNTADNNRLYYKADSGEALLASNISCDPCLCELTAKTMCSWNEGLLNGTLTAVQYTALINLNVTFTCSDGTNTLSETITTTP